MRDLQVGCLDLKDFSNFNDFESYHVPQRASQCKV